MTVGDEEVQKNGNVEVIHEDNSVELNSLVELGNNYLAVYSKQVETEGELNRKKLDLAEKVIDSSKASARYKYGLILFITFVFCVIVLGLIFYKDDVSSGLLILSHLVALISGAFAGWGWEKKHGSLSIEDI